MSLPDNCIQMSTNTATYDVGFCLSSKGCRSNSANKTDTCIDESKSCCVPSRLELKTLNCTGFKLEVVVVKECSCGGCDTELIIVNGKAVGAKSGLPLINGEIWLNGEFDSYTDMSGMFNVTVKNSVDRAIITVKDTYHKEYLDAIKIIDITDNLSGRISTTIRMLKAAVPVVVDSSVDTVIRTLPTENASENDVAEILIPANSFFTKQGDKYSGNVSCKMTFINPVDTDTDEIPGQFEFIDQEGSNTQLATKGVFNIQIEGEKGQELIIDDVIDVSFPGSNDQNMTLWKLNEATGIWDQVVVGSESKRRKRRRTAGLIGEIDMTQFSSHTWFNLDKPSWLNNVCFFKIRVYKDDDLFKEITSSSIFKMEHHKIKNNILTTFYGYMFGSGTTCFPASCENNNIEYIRLFFHHKVTLWETRRDLYVADIQNIPASYYDILDGGKTLKVHMIADMKGPFYSEEAVCKASGINDNHLRFRLQSQDDFTFLEVTPVFQPIPLDELQAIQSKVWYPLIEGVHKICFIKINVTVEIDVHKPDYWKLRFNVVSQGDNISNIRDFVFGVRGFNVDAKSIDTTHCVEYKCSGELEGSNSVVDYTRVKVGIRQPSPYHCHVIDIQDRFKKFEFGINHEQRNLYADQQWYGFDGYAPTDYGISYGIYDMSTDDPRDREAARKSARQRCFERCKEEYSNAAFTLVCR